MKKHDEDGNLDLNFKASVSPDSAGKIEDLSQNTESGLGEFLTTNQGAAINDNQNTLKAGHRGPSLLEDFIMREKITHFDHERIPERVVHARGSRRSRILSGL